MYATCVPCFYPQPVQDTSLNGEIHTNLVNAALTGLSCNDTGFVSPPLRAIFYLSQRRGSFHRSQPRLVMRVRQTKTTAPASLCNAGRFSCRLHFESARAADICGFVRVCFVSIICRIKALCLHCMLEIFASLRSVL